MKTTVLLSIIFGLAVHAQEVSKMITVNPATGETVVTRTPAPLPKTTGAEKRRKAQLQKAGTAPAPAPAPAPVAPVQGIAEPVRLVSAWPTTPVPLSQLDHAEPAVRGAYTDPAPSASELSFTLEVQRPGMPRQSIGAAAEFHKEDKLWIRLRSPISGHVYVTEQTSGFPTQTIFPDATVPTTAAYLPAGQVLILPAADRPFVFDDRAGEVCVIIGIIPDSVNGLDRRPGTVISKGLRMSPQNAKDDSRSESCTMVLKQTDSRAAEFR
ncbi:MAG TPA: hypothetical protein VGN17_01870 [Bryobacteraceae bacterium]|jgi:hypothetical protein